MLRRPHTSLAYNPSSFQSGFRFPLHRTEVSGQAWKGFSGDFLLSWLCSFLNSAIHGLPSLEDLPFPEDLLGLDILAKQAGKKQKEAMLNNQQYHTDTTFLPSIPPSSLPPFS